VFEVYQHALRGFAVKLSAAQAVALSEDPAVASVQADGVVHATTDQNPVPIGATGIDRIDQHSLPLDGHYHYGPTAANVHAYIIDTGIQTNVADLGGRATFGVDEIFPPDGTLHGVDCGGHGTHVSGILGGNAYGVAKNVSLVEVRVLDCNGSGSDSEVIAGVDWVSANAISPAVANMSLGTPFGSPDPTLDTAITNSEIPVRATSADGITTFNTTTVVAADGSFSNADVGKRFTDSLNAFPQGTTITSVTSSTAAVVSANATATAANDIFSIGSGLTYAVAAGNSSGDACQASPSNLGGANSSTLSVAASDPTSDAQASFSNFGLCVDLYAPGVNITSDGTNNGSSTLCQNLKCTLSGTSMATPHAAGTAALYLSEHTAAMPSQVKSAITSDATVNAITSATPGTPNKLDYTGASFPSLTATGNGAGTVHLSWTVPTSDGGSPITGYNVYRGTTTGGEATTAIAPGVAGTSYDDNNLTCGTARYYEVSAVNAVGETRSVEQAASPCGSTYTGLFPHRILDTRSAPFGPIGVPQAAPLGPGGILTLQVTGGAGNPPNGGHVTAVVMNVTATNEQTLGYLTVYPTGEPAVPLASNLDTAPLHDVSNLVTVGVNATGQVNIFNGGVGSSDVIADVVGFFNDGSPSDVGSQYNAQTPTRILDTRGSLGGHQGPIAGGQTFDLTIPSLCANATAVVLNLTATDESTASFLTVYPTGGARPNASNLNMYPGTNLANLAVVKLGTSNHVTIYNNGGSTDVVIDLTGCYSTTTGQHFTATSPVRILDTRTSTGGHPGPIGQNQTLNLTVAGPGAVPAGATAAVINVTSTNATGPPSFITVFPEGSQLPLASNLNPYAGQNIPNLDVATLGGAGGVTIYNDVGSVDVIADVSGFYQ
jgi:subtilisin family serine protease